MAGRTSQPPGPLSAASRPVPDPAVDGDACKSVRLQWLGQRRPHPGRCRTLRHGLQWTGIARTSVACSSCCSRLHRLQPPGQLIALPHPGASRASAPGVHPPCSSSPTGLASQPPWASKAFAPRDSPTVQQQHAVVELGQCGAVAHAHKGHSCTKGVSRGEIAMSNVDAWARTLHKSATCRHTMIDAPH